MPSNSYPIIAREGWLPATLLFLLLVFAAYFLGIIITLVTSALLVVFLYLLRDPPREVPSSPLAVVSPTHGRILTMSEVEDEWVGGQCQKIRLRVSPLDIYSIRSPIEGKVVNQWTRKPGGEHSNRLFAFRVRSDEGDEIVIVIHLNLLTASLFRFYVHSGERLGHGQRCGFLFLGGLIEVLLPMNSRIRVQAGDRIASGSGILAQMVHNTGTSSIMDTQATT